MKIKKSIVETIKSNEIINISSDIVEAIIDSTLDDGILKDIPIIGTIISLNKGVLSLQDRIFSKKILAFISQLKDIPQKQRNEAIDKIENSSKEKIKVGEKILYLIDKSDDHVKAQMIGILFSEYIKGNIDYNEFKRCSEIINKAFLDDLLWFIDSDLVELSLEESKELIPSGLFELPFELRIKDVRNTEEFMFDGFVIKGFETSTISCFAKIIRKSLKGKVS